MSEIENVEAAREKLKNLYQTNNLGRPTVGSFKSVYPLEKVLEKDPASTHLTEETRAYFKGKAVVVVREGNQSSLEAEIEELKFLTENDFPALKIYGEIFEISPPDAQKKVYAVVVDWVPQATLLDSKVEKTIIPELIKALIVGNKVPSGEEAWAMKRSVYLSQTQKAFQRKLRGEGGFEQFEQFEQMKKFAKVC